MLAALRSRQQEVFKRQKSDRLTRLCRARSSVAEARIGDHCARENIAGTVADFECAVSWILANQSLSNTAPHLRRSDPFKNLEKTFCGSRWI